MRENDCTKKELNIIGRWGRKLSRGHSLRRFVGIT